MSVVVDFDVFEHNAFCLVFGFECVMMQLLGFDGVEEALHGALSQQFPLRDMEAMRPALSSAAR